MCTLAVASSRQVTFTNQNRFHLKTIRQPPSLDATVAILKCFNSKSGIILGRLRRAKSISILSSMGTEKTNLPKPEYLLCMINYAKLQVAEKSLLFALKHICCFRHPGFKARKFNPKELHLKREIISASVRLLGDHERFCFVIPHIAHHFRQGDTS